VTARQLPTARFDLGAPAVWLVPLLALAASLVVLLGNWNQPLFLAFNRLGPSTSDIVWAHITVLGDTVVALALCLPLWRRRPDLVWALAIGALLATAWVHSLKPAVQVPRPLALLGEQVHVIGPAYRKQSFPSGHSTTSFAVAGLLALGLAPRRSRSRASGSASEAEALPFPGVAHAAAWGGLALLLAALAALSRSVVGVHWPLDLLAGAFGGWLSAAIALALARRTLAFGTRESVQWVVGLLLAGCAVALVLGHDSGYPQAMAFQRLIGLACLVSAAVALRRELARRNPGGLSR
jgi:membrane-associated phospholipid phosphatase